MTRTSLLAWQAAGAVALAAFAALAGGCPGDPEPEKPKVTPKPGPCGGVACAEDEYCLFPPGDCGKGGPTPGDNGLCEKLPTSCEGRDTHKVCACDGQVHASTCEAAQAGLSLGDGEECAIPPEGMFACGSYFCTSGADWCFVLQPLLIDMEEPTRLECEEVPASCASSPDCACLEAAATDPMTGHCETPPSCTQDSSGFFTLECRGEDEG